VVSPLELELCTEAELHKAAGAAKARTRARALARCALQRACLGVLRPVQGF